MRLSRPPSPSWAIRAPLIALLVLSIAAASACTDQRPATPAPKAGEAMPAPQELRWEGCGGRLQCARLRVPVDYAKPTGDTIELALVRAPARKPGQRIGSLVINPGGPGGSGVSFVRATADTFYGPSLRDRFDLVGFDPRGVGGSAPMRCQTDAEKDHEMALADVVPENEAEHQELIDSSKRFVAGCEKSSNARLLPYLTTDAAARDMDVLRAALGDDKLSYLGLSYGSVLGATYASIFPTKVRAMVLDAAVDPTVWINQPDQTVRAQAKGFEQAFNAFLADCKARAGDCGFGSGDPGAAYDRLEARLDDAPIKAKSTGDQRPVNGYVAFLAVNAALYYRPNWPQLADALEMADEEGDGGALLALADSLNGRQPNGVYDNLNDANAGVNCVDEVNPTDAASFDRLSDELGKESPRFGRAFAYARLICAYWPVKAASRFTGPFRAEGAPPIVVVGTTGDPAAPYAWARSLASQLSTGVLLTWRGFNHGAYGMSACVNRAVDGYLTGGPPPKDGSICA